MNTFIDLLRGKGYKITPQRRAVIAALQSFHHFPTAQEVLERVKKTHPRASLDTIYRNLNILVQLGVVQEINLRHKDGAVFEIAAGGHHHHLICLHCGRTECIAGCPLGEQLAAQAEAKEFEITGHVFEIYGRCRDCRRQF